MSTSSRLQEAVDIRDAIRRKQDELDVLRARLAQLETEHGQEQGLTSTQNVAHVDALGTSQLLRTVCSHRFTQDEYQRYGRQLTIPEVGPRGQAKIRHARVLVVGVGGLGCPAAAYLAGAGVGTLGLIDGDTVDTSNLHRQILHSTGRVGMSKVDSAVQYLKELNPLVTYKKYKKHLSAEEAIGIFEQYDLILDCTDHPMSRYLISDACVLTRKPLVSASALKTDGQLIVLNDPPRPPGDNTGGPCYRCIFQKPPPPETLVNCSEGGILGPVVGVMGVLQALEALKLLSADENALGTPTPRMLIFTAYGEPQFRSVRMRKRRGDCIACSSTPSITRDTLRSGSIDYVAFCGTAEQVERLPSKHRVTAQELAKVVPSANTALVDTRDRIQFEICSLPSSINVPWTGDRASWMEDAMQEEHLRNAKDVYVVCRLGNDSQLAADALLRQGHFEHVHDIEGGFGAWRQHVDPTWPDY